MNGILTFGLILFFIISFFIVYEISRDKKQDETQDEDKDETKEKMLNIRKLILRSDLPMFMVKRRECYGHCPTYNAAFFYDGTVGYFGEESESRRGYYEFRLTDDQFKNINNLMDKIDIENLADEYDCQITSKNSTIVTFYCANFIKRVNVRCDVPEDLDEFLNAVHQLIMKRTKI